ncbi:DUF4041 domain-containing protein [Domibacillus indicus]|uniref:DUF4041 domain-containing protein n=1 Tax=Domibacillus indicus TaxID=1437523 RepID=UPI002041B8C0|nr:DUF4041 domain-containing protein [Domibacillus indicus]MCM3790336.1 DUF4041 domain-containing protein [Domibacillus indicus]
MYKEKWQHSVWFISLLSALWFLVVPVIIAIVLIIQRRSEMKKAQVDWENSGFAELKEVQDKLTSLKHEYQMLSDKKTLILKELDEFAPLHDLSVTKTQLKKKIDQLENQKTVLLTQLSEINSFSEIQSKKEKVTNDIDNLHSKKQELAENISSLQQKLVDVEEELQMQSFGFYEPKYGFETSEMYQKKLDKIRSEQKQLVKDRAATHHSLDWTIGNDKKKGREFILDTIKLTLRAFNNECDNIISKVKFSNVEASEKRLMKVYTELNKLTDMQSVSITKHYCELKLKELDLKYEFEQKKQEEKEEQQAIKEQMREEAKALKELEKAKEKVEKEEKHFEQAIEKMNMQLANSNDAEKEKLLAKLRELEAQLADTKRNKEDVLFRVQNTRAGYVYIISNIGSFGENVYKIGMTRRLEPMDRVKELGDASVPFTFDVHAMIFCEDAPALENALHKSFAKNKVNKVNDRKEFFRVTLQEIEQVVTKNYNKTVEFTKLAIAEDYRQSVQMEKEMLQLA